MRASVCGRRREYEAEARCVVAVLAIA
jgi:hypothetical protein